MCSGWRNGRSRGLPAPDVVSTLPLNGRRAAKTSPVGRFVRSIISGLVGGLIAIALTSYIARRVGKATVPGQLEFGAFMWALAAGCLAFALLATAAMVADDRDFWAKAVLGGVKRERWADLESIELNDWCSWYTLRFRSGKTIRLSRYLGGHLSALELAAQRLEGEDE